MDTDQLRKKFLMKMPVVHSLNLFYGNTVAVAAVEVVAGDVFDAQFK